MSTNTQTSIAAAGPVTPKKTDGYKDVRGIPESFRRTLGQIKDVWAPQGEEPLRTNYRFASSHLGTLYYNWKDSSVRNWEYIKTGGDFAAGANISKYRLIQKVSSAAGKVLRFIVITPIFIIRTLACGLGALALFGASAITIGRFNCLKGRQGLADFQNLNPKNGQDRFPVMLDQTRGLVDAEHALDSTAVNRLYSPETLKFLPKKTRHNILVSLVNQLRKIDRENGPAQAEIRKQLNSACSIEFALFCQEKVKRKELLAGMDTLNVWMADLEQEIKSNTCTFKEMQGPVTVSPADETKTIEGTIIEHMKGGPLYQKIEGIASGDERVRSLSWGYLTVYANEPNMFISRSIPLIKDPANDNMVLSEGLVQMPVVLSLADLFGISRPSMESLVDLIVEQFLSVEEDMGRLLDVYIKAFCLTSANENTMRRLIDERLSVYRSREEYFQTLGTWASSPAGQEILNDVANALVYNLEGLVFPGRIVIDDLSSVEPWIRELTKNQPRFEGKNEYAKYVMEKVKGRAIKRIKEAEGAAEARRVEIRQQNAAAHEAARQVLRTEAETAVAETIKVAANIVYRKSYSTIEVRVFLTQQTTEFSATHTEEQADIFNDLLSNRAKTLFATLEQGEDLAKKLHEQPDLVSSTVGAWIDEQMALKKVDENKQEFMRSIALGNLHLLSRKAEEKQKKEQLAQEQEVERLRLEAERVEAERKVEQTRVLNGSLQTIIDDIPAAMDDISDAEARKQAIHEHVTALFLFVEDGSQGIHLTDEIKDLWLNKAVQAVDRRISMKEMEAKVVQYQSTAEEIISGLSGISNSLAQIKGEVDSMSFSLPETTISDWEDNLVESELNIPTGITQGLQNVQDGLAKLKEYKQRIIDFLSQVDTLSGQIESLQEMFNEISVAHRDSLVRNPSFEKAEAVKKKMEDAESSIQSLGANNWITKKVRAIRQAGKEAKVSQLVPFSDETLVPAAVSTLATGDALPQTGKGSRRPFSSRGESAAAAPSPAPAPVIVEPVVQITPVSEVPNLVRLTSSTDEAPASAPRKGVVSSVINSLTAAGQIVSGYVPFWSNRGAREQVSPVTTQVAADAAKLPEPVDLKDVAVALPVGVKPEGLDEAGPSVLQPPVVSASSIGASSDGSSFPDPVTMVIGKGTFRRWFGLGSTSATNVAKIPVTPVAQVLVLPQRGDDGYVTESEGVDKGLPGIPEGVNKDPFTLEDLSDIASSSRDPKEKQKTD